MIRDTVNGDDFSDQDDDSSQNDYDSQNEDDYAFDQEFTAALGNWENLDDLFNET